MPPTTQPLRDKELLVAATNKIIQYPACHNQKKWHSKCGTKHCWGGHIQVMGGREETSDVVQDVIELTGMSSSDVRYCCDANRTVPEIHRVVDDFINDRDGYDRAGYDRAGYNRDGYDRAGYNRDGYNRDGYNQ